MSIWFFLWFIFAVVMIFVTGWSTYILVQQKQAWKKYAADKKISFRPNKFFAPCEMDGTVEEFTVSFFTGEQQNPNARKNRQLTIFEIIDPTPYVDGMACGNDQMKAFISLLDALTPHIVKSDNWNNSNVISSRHKPAVNAYLTPQRIKIIDEMIRFPKSDVIAVLDGEQGVFRFETSNPLTDAGKIDEMLNKLFARIRKLRPTAEERQQFAKLAKAVDDPTLVVDDLDKEEPKEQKADGVETAPKDDNDKAES